MRQTRSAAIVVLLALLLGSVAWAQGPATPKPPQKEAPPAAPSAAKTPPEMTAADLEAFLDGAMPLQLRREDIAGAVVLVVKDGQVLFAKGYGFADVAKRTPVTPDSTLFRPGSISKLFTWTAVMQLVEQGKLDLDKDVNGYLDFTIPPRDGKPITLRNIMTHTPGFEEVIQELFVGKASDLKPIDRYLKEHLPARIFPPGEVPAYSNYATALAGYIVQRVSGQPFDDYLEQHILQPLGMERTTFRQPLPKALEPLMSQGYALGSQPAKTFEFVEAVPAGSSSLTATDIARFMIAHLQDGRYGDVQILRPETARLMHTRQFENVPEMNGMCLGFYEESRNGHRILGHGGDTQWFHSDLHLIPEAGVGFFISYNSAGKGEISPRSAVWRAFLDRYFPYEPPQAKPPATASQDGQSVAGRYTVSRRLETNILSVSALLGETTVTYNPDGTISSSDLKDMNGQLKRYREIAPMVFRQEHGQDRLAFKRDAAGRWVMVFDFPIAVFQRTPWNRDGRLNLPVIIVSLAVFLLTLLLWPVAALLRRHYGRKLELTPSQKRWRLLARLACALNLSFVIAFAVTFVMASKDIGLLSSRMDLWLRIVQIVGWLGVLGTLPALYQAVRSWTEPGRWLWARLGDTLIALCCVGFAWFVCTWHLLHWSLKY